MLRHWILQHNFALSERVEHDEFSDTSWKHSLYRCCFGELLATDLDIQSQMSMEILQLLSFSHPL